MKCFPILKSAKPMIAMVMPVSIRIWAVAVVAQGLAGGFSDAFGDIFGDIFGGGGGRRQRGGPQVYRGADLRYNLDITLEQAANGFETTIRVPSWNECDTCHGSGAKPGTSANYVRYLRWSWPSSYAARVFQYSANLPQVPRLLAKSYADPCGSPCAGSGRIKRNKTLEVKIPAGIDDGMRIRSTGNGEPGMNGGPTGDLYVEIHIKQHAVFPA
jgi:molecular chaperone DnaJ